MILTVVNLKKNTKQTKQNKKRKKETCKKTRTYSESYNSNTMKRVNKMLMLWYNVPSKLRLEHVQQMAIFVLENDIVVLNALVKVHVIHVIIISLY